MKEHYPTIPVTATPGFVLDVIIDEHRQQLNYDPEAEPDVILRFDSTVADWRLASDLLPSRQLGQALNKWWNVEIADDDWREVLDPARTKTLRGVCQLIASHTKAPTVRPISVFGRSCAPAATFLTIRSILHEHGADVAEVRPSTPLRQFARDHLTAFLGPISRLAPGAIPDVKIETPLSDTLAVVLIAFLLLLIPAAWLGESAPWFMIFVVVSILVVWLLTWIAAKQKPANVQFGDLRTFGELATVIADHASAEEIAVER